MGCMQKLYAYKNILIVKFEKASQNLALEAVSSGTKWQIRDMYVLAKKRGFNPWQQSVSV